MEAGRSGQASAGRPERPHTYATLDGLRGVAALIVVTRHIGALLPDPPFPESFLAVDLFFLLSGFVIAHAYEARLIAGTRERLSLGRFMRIRLVRLYPLYVLGIGLGLLNAMVEARSTGVPLNGVFLTEATVIGLLMAPGVPPLPMRSSTLDGPTWTLFPELLVNFIYAIGLRRLSSRLLIMIVALGGFALVACERVYGSLDEGWSFTAFPLIGARLAFSFFLGVAFHRLRLPRSSGNAAALGCLVALAAVLMVAPPPHFRQIYELAAVLLAFPIIVFAAVQYEPRRDFSRVCRFLGLVSYAVYVLHEPLGELVGRALKSFGWRSEGPAPAIVFVLGLIALCALTDRIYDSPVRRWLQGRNAGGASPSELSTAVAHLRSDC